MRANAYIHPTDYFLGAGTLGVVSTLRYGPAPCTFEAAAGFAGFVLANSPDKNAHPEIAELKMIIAEYGSQTWFQKNRFKSRALVLLTRNSHFIDAAVQTFVPNGYDSGKYERYLRRIKMPGRDLSGLKVTRLRKRPFFASKFITTL
jgi:hypothetical protein